LKRAARRGAGFIQGIAGALIWSGALTWIIQAYPMTSAGR